MLKQRGKQRLEATQIKFLRPLLGLTRFDKKSNKYIRKTPKAENTIQEVKERQND